MRQRIIRRTTSLSLSFLLLVALVSGTGCRRGETPESEGSLVEGKRTPTPRVVATSTLEAPSGTPSPSQSAVTPLPTSWQMVVVAEVAGNVRSTPNEEAEVLATIPAGSEVTVLDFDREWYKIQAQGMENPGWMHQSVLGEILTEDLSRTPSTSEGNRVDLFPRQLVIVADTVANVRAGSSEEDAVIATLARGTVVEAQDYANEYYEIEASKLEDTGWVHETLLAEATDETLPPSPTPPAATATATSAPVVEETPTRMYVVADEVANVRSAPRDGAELVGQLDRGVSVQVYEQDGDWYRIRAQELEDEGWIFSELLSSIPPEG